MIVISGALVLVALVLLVFGLVGQSLGFVYASIAVSVVSFVFLLIGILQRRGEQVPETSSATDTARPAAPVAPVPAGVGADDEGVTAILPAARAAESTSAPEAAAAAEESAAAAPAASSAAEVSGSVLVVPGRPRYHVAGCRYLTGKDPDEVSVQSARDDKYTTCGVCKPDEALAEAASAQDADLPPAAAIVAAEDAGDSAAADPVEAAKRTTRATATTSPGRTPAKKAAAKAPAKTAPAKAAKKAPAKAASAASGDGGKVVVIPDRGKFHKADCRFVRDASDTKEMTRAAAARGGYAACGVCKP